jgi:prepilin-type processing-associated H-X9-DG protein
LSYLGQDNIRDIGKGLTGTGSGGAKYAALGRLYSAVVPVFNCPSRRSAIGYPNTGYASACNASSSATKIAKTDYAVNGGTVTAVGSGPSLACLTAYPSCDWTTCFNANTTTTAAMINGVSLPHSQIKPIDIADGLSFTFFAGEKYLNPDDYTTGNDGADNGSMYQGNDWDNARWCANVPQRDTPGSYPCSRLFGSPHAFGVNFVMCDGSVQTIGYAINVNVYRCLSNRADSTPINARQVTY